jgi:hypothetical protein
MLLAGAAAMGMADAPAHEIANGAYRMAIYRLLQQTAFSPEDIALLVKAYEECLHQLKLSGGVNEQTEAVAKAVIEVAQTGVRDPGQICQQVMAQLKA